MHRMVIYVEHFSSSSSFCFFLFDVVRQHENCANAILLPLAAVAFGDIDMCIEIRRFMQ